MNITQDLHARIVLNLGVEPPAPAVYAFVRDEGAVKALHRITEGTAPVAVLNRFIAPASNLVSDALSAHRAPGGQATFLTPEHEAWPGHLLDTLPDHTPRPIGIWVAGGGGASLAELPASAAITGTEHPTPYGNRTAAELAERLAGAGDAVVVGAGQGISATALQSALEAGYAPAAPPVVVLSHGLFASDFHVLWPQIVAHGGILVSEYPLGAGSSRARRIVRDRLVAALGVCTVVVEAATHDYEVETARVAATIGRRVFAVPGTIDAPLSVGTNRLIQKGRATLLANYEQIMPHDTTTELLRCP